MELVRWQPFEGLTRLHSRIDDLFDESLARGRGNPGYGSAVWSPPVDVLESKDSYLLRAELPGMKKEDVQLEVNNGTLTLTGERKAETPANGVEYRSVERLAGKFSRSFYLPRSVKQEAIQATYRDGILEIHVPKADEAKARQIAID